MKEFETRFGDATSRDHAKFVTLLSIGEAVFKEFGERVADPLKLPSAALHLEDHAMQFSARQARPEVYGGRNLLDTRPVMQTQHRGESDEQSVMLSRGLLSKDDALRG